MRADTYRAFVADRDLANAAGQFGAHDLLNGARDRLIERSGARSVDSARLAVAYDPIVFGWKMEVTFESVAWTGYVARDLGPDHAWWQFGPLQWRRAGVLAMLNVGPLALIILGRRWKLGWLGPKEARAK